MLKCIAAVAVVLLLAACEAEPSEFEFEGGERLVIHRNGAGETMRPGELATFHFEVYNGDSLINSTVRDGAQPNKFIVPPPNSVGDARNPLVRSLRYLGAGDSASLYQPLDTTQPPAPGIDVAAGIRYVFSVLTVGDSIAANAYTADQQAEAAAAQAAVAAAQARAEAAGPANVARRPAVQDSVETLLADYRRLGAEGAGYNTTASGLMYKILEPGIGPQPKPGQAVSVSYYGALTSDDTNFDDSFKRGPSFMFPLGAGRVIRGWDEGIALLNQGARAMLIVPSQLGYGPRGQGDIPPNAELAFYVQLDDVN